MTLSKLLTSGTVTTPLNETAHIIIGRGVEDIVGRADLDQLPVLEHGDAIADSQGLVQVMGNKHDGFLQGALQLQ